MKMGTRRWLGKSAIAMVMLVVITFTSVFGGVSFGKMNEVQAEGELSAGFSGIQTVIKVGTEICNLTNEVAALGTTSTQYKFEYTLDSIFGTNFTGEATTDAKVDHIYETIDEVNDKVDSINQTANEINQGMNAANAKLDTINSKLDRQEETLADISDGVAAVKDEVAHVSNKISEMNTNLSNQIAAGNEKLTANLFNATAEIKNTTELLGNLKSYFTSFDGLVDSVKISLSDLKRQQVSYQKFLDEVNSEKDGEKIRDIISGMTLNYGDSYNALTEEEQQLLETKVTDQAKEIPDAQTIDQYLRDYHASMKKSVDVIFAKKDGYKDNLYETARYMGEYIIGNVSAVGNCPIGEIFYKLCIMNYSTNQEAQEAYTSFMSTVLRNYYVTVYLCELALAYMVAYDTVNNGNTQEILKYKDYIKDIHTQMKQVQARCGYEPEHFTRDYDFKNYKDGEFEKSLCYYGNLKNAQNNITGWKCEDKVDVYTEATLSSNIMVLAVAESKPLYYYQDKKDYTEAVSWSSSDERVAVVNADGMVTAVGEGNAEITASYGNKNLKCVVSVTNGCFIANDTGTSNYHYGNTSYTIPNVTRSGDYYYNTTSYSRSKVTLSADMKAVSLVEATGLTDAEIALYTWSSCNPEVAACIDGQITMTDKGMGVIFGYRYLTEEDHYECVAIPVEVTVDTSSHWEKDNDIYADYTKISSKEDLITLSKNADGSMWNADKKYVLTKDIDLGGMEWSPIGYQFTLTDVYGGNSVKIKKAFAGTFDGNGYTISNFKITEVPYQEEMVKASNEAYKNNSSVKSYRIETLAVGLFGYTESAAIQNLNIEKSVIKIGSDEKFKQPDKKIIWNNEEKTITWDGSYYIYAGALVGNAVQPDKSISKLEPETWLTYDANTNQSGLKEGVDFSSYEKNMPEVIKKLGCQSSIYVQYIICERTKIIEDMNVISNCTVNADIEVDGDHSEVGALAGHSEGNINHVSVAGKVYVKENTMEGAVGGMVGNWSPSANIDIYNCKSEVNVTVESNDGIAGGLIGMLERNKGTVCLQDLIIKESEINDANLSKLEDKANYFVGAILFATSFTKDEIRNNRIGNCQVTADVSGGGFTGGLIGKKILDADRQMIYTYDESKGTLSYKNIMNNVDIYGCYVNGDVTSTNGAAAGLIGGIARYLHSDVAAGNAWYGTIENCYTYGTIQAATDVAGVIAVSTKNAKKITDEIQLKGIIVGNKVLKIQDSENLPSPVRDTSMTEVKCDTKQIGIYKDIDMKYINGGSIKEEIKAEYGEEFFIEYLEAQGTLLSTDNLNEASTYFNYWGEDNSFCNLNALDYNNEIVPTPLKQRCFFNVERAKKYYHVGDSFESLDEITWYTGNGSKAVTTEITSSIADSTKLTEAGIHKVTVTYEKSDKQKFTTSYNIYVYPVEESYLKVTEMPKLTQNGDSYTISGGKVGVYKSDKSLEETVDISDCTVSYETKDGYRYIRISYGKLSTALKVITVRVYANTSVGKAEAELIKTAYYLEGDTIKKDIVPLKRTVQSEGSEYEVELENAGITKDTTAENDLYILNLYKNIVFNLTINGSSSQGTTIKVDKGNAVLPECTEKAPDGYKFAGWSSTKDGKAEYQPGDSITIGKNTTIYAVWEKIETSEPTPGSKPEQEVEHTHSFGVYESDKNATVFTDGTETAVCSICGAKNTVTAEGTKLKAIIKVPDQKFAMKRKQSVSKFTVTMAKGDSIKSVKSGDKKKVAISKINKSGGFFTIKAGTKLGKAKVTIVLKSGKKIVLNITVQKGNVKTKSITGLKNLSLKKGKSKKLVPVIKPLTSKEKITYKTSKKKVATVSKKGVITAKGKGKTKITVKSGKCKKVITVTVK